MAATLILSLVFFACELVSEGKADQGGIFSNVVITHICNGLQQVTRFKMLQSSPDLDCYLNRSLLEVNFMYGTLFGKCVT